MVMKFNSSLIKIWLVVICLIALIWNIALFMYQKKTAVVIHDGAPSRISADGFSFNDTSGKVIGDPDKAEKQMEMFYGKFLIYKKKYEVFPGGNLKPGFIRDVATRLSDYGFNNFEQVKDFVRNPDVGNSDKYRNFPKESTVLPIIMVAQRPDGTPISMNKKDSLKDVIAFTDIYFYRNEKIFPNGKIESKPVGFYIVLWEDGEVKRINHEDVLYVYPQKAVNYNEYFPGQSGKPGQLFSYNENRKMMKPIGQDGQNPNLEQTDGRAGTDPSL